MSNSPDIVVIGSGIGGASIVSSLASTGKSILILERGNVLADTKTARCDRAIFQEGVYRPQETWLDGDDQPFSPGNYYYLGGNSKFFGAVMLRYREEDFETMSHLGGVSPKWPISYSQMEPWYQAAEALFQVRGAVGEDPTEPQHSECYSFLPVADEPAISRVRKYLSAAGVTPSSLPLGIDIDRWLARAETPWDAFPDTTGAKMDAESVLRRWGLSCPNVSLETNAEVTRLVTDNTGKIVGVEYQKEGNAIRLNPKWVVLSAGAVNSAVLLLKSANSDFPMGLANRSDLVGRNFMNHNCSAVMAFHPMRLNDSVYQKTLQFNDFYLEGGPNNAPLGNVQLLGKVTGNILAAQSAIPRGVANWFSNRSVAWYAMSEDLPSPDSRVTLAGEKIKLDWKRSNWQTHQELVKKTKSVMRKAGYPVVLSQVFDRQTPSHQCGTAKFGTNPSTSVLDTYCRSHDHENLFVVDASFLPTSAAVNPSLTIAAQALRVGAHIKSKDLVQ